MATIDYSGKAAYMYDQATDTWYAISGAVNTAASYVWTGAQEFQNTVTFDDVVKAKAGLNNFQLESDRDANLPSPPDGTVCFVQQTNTGSVINQVQYYYNGRWRYINDSTTINAPTTLDSPGAGYTLALSDAGKTLLLSKGVYSFPLTVPANSAVPFPVGSRVDVVRMGIADLEFVPASGVTILSKNSHKKISTRYSAATIIKTDTNTWLLIGDLKA